MRGDSRLLLAAGERLADPASMREFFEESRNSAQPYRGAIIQFDRLPDDLTRQSLAARGVILEQYIPNMAFLASVPASMTEADLTSAGVRWVGALRREEKLAEPLRVSNSTVYAQDERGIPRFILRLFAAEDLEAAAVWLAAEYGAEVLGIARNSRAIDIALPANNWYDLAGDERVRWIEPFMPRRELNNSNRVNTTAELAQAAPYNLNGSGAVVGEWDGGGVYLSHPDFGGRVVSGDGSGISSHATHVAGSVLGSGVSSGGTYRGMAPGANMVSYQWWGGSTDLENDYTQAINLYDIDMTTNSWGVGYPPDSEELCEAFLGNYFSECGTLDDAVRGDLGKTLVQTWAAGNERSTGPDYCGSLGFSWGTLLPYSCAKNVLTIGAINSNNSTMTSFSSWGPTDDGRIKPELVTGGCQSDGDFGVTSTRNGGGYSVACGTSMATPTAAGCIALWLGRYKELYPGSVPLSSTVKSAFIQGADDLSDAGPEFDFGYGRLNVVNAIDVLNSGAFVEDQITDNDTLTWTFAYDGSITELQFTLVWDDPGAAENASPTLVNDLDLRVRGGGPLPPTYLPWVLNPADPFFPATTGVDHTNNVEQVYRDVPGYAPGTWKVLVIGYNVPVGPQKFSITHTPGLTLVPGEQAHAVSISASEDLSLLPGNHSLPVQVFNTGKENDTFELSFTSTHGWSVTPNPAYVPVAGRGDTTASLTLSIPGGVLPGTVDTIIVDAVSQADAGVTDSDTVIVTTLAGYGVSVVAQEDTAGVPGRSIDFPVTFANLGTQGDSFDWSVADDAGWVITPVSGSFTLALGGDTTITLNAQIPAGAAPGSLNRIIAIAVSAGDPLKSGRDTVDVNVIAFPPLPVLIDLVANDPTANTTPDLLWSHAPHAPLPPGFDVFSHALEIGADTALTVGMTRYDGIADTAFSIPVPLPDGAHYWRVITYNSAGDSSGFSASARFDVDTQSPDAPMLLSPPDQSYGADVTPAFTWGSVTARTLAASAGVMLYHWELSFDSTFGSIRDSLTTSSQTYQLPANRALSTCSTVVFWRVSATDPAGNESLPSAAARHELFAYGDMNGDCVIDAVDLSLLIDFVFFAGATMPPPDRGEMNCTLGVDATDLAYMIDLVYFGGPAACNPN